MPKVGGDPGALRFLVGAAFALGLGASWTLALYDGPALYYHLLGFGFDPDYEAVLLAPEFGLGTVLVLLVVAFASRTRWPAIAGGLALAVFLTGVHFAFGKDLENLPLTPANVLAGVLASLPNALVHGAIHAALAYGVVAGVRALLRIRCRLGS